MSNRIIFKSTTRTVAYSQLAPTQIRLFGDTPTEEPRPLIPTGEEAGILTSRAWLKAHAQGGTNRRMAEKAMEEFLCTPIADLRDKTLSDYRVRQDVDRQPGGDATVYLGKCRSCHAGLDAAAGAFARLNFIERSNEDTREQFAVNQPADLAGKLFRNDTTYKEGYRAVDDSFVNLWTTDRFSSLGWRGATQGRGAKQFGMMLANSRAFSVCMAKRVLEKVCPGANEISNLKEIQQNLADEFEAPGSANKPYNMKRLFESAASLPECLGR